MAMQLRRQRNRGFSLFCYALALGPAIEHAARNVDPSSPDSGLQRCAADGAGARPSVEREQDEPGDVLARAPTGRLALLHFAVAPGCPQQPRRLLASEPSLAR